ncbi:hypothetical protein T484DRAFT_1777693 [Baffinella frigidus]|nr:hypothetical protein T484DRAFT_1777693 [Cryptophyta sp. CCMP2293]
MPIAIPPSSPGGADMNRERRYMSWDLADNSVGREILAVVSRHNPARVVPFAIPLSPAAHRSPPERAAMEQLRRACEKRGGGWIEIDDAAPGGAGHGLANAVARVNGARLHILIDAQGWGRGHALRVLAAHPAPIQVSWKNFVGSVGSASLLPVLVSDRIATPPEHRFLFAESLLILPSSFYATGHHLLPPHSDPPVVVGNAHAARPANLLAVAREVGVEIPQEGFVLGVFNNLRKVRREDVAEWCLLLGGLIDQPGGRGEGLGRDNSSFLWIVANPPFAVPAIRRTLLRCGVEAHRVIVSPKLARADHMKVKALASVAWDALPFNGHSTSVEALWEGIPLLSVPGARMAGRVGATILLAANLPLTVALLNPKP